VLGASMYCPNCSMEASTDQKFCRACGMELQAVADLVAGQAGIAKPDNATGGTFQTRHRAMIIWGFILTFGAAGIGAGLKILGKENIHPAGELTPYISVIAVLLAFFGMGLMSYPFLQMMSPGRRSRSSRAATPNSEPTVKLKPELLTELPPSVTDLTTELLDASESPIKVRDTAPRDE